MKILTTRMTTSEHSRVGRRVNGNGHDIPPGQALQVELDGELERCARVSTGRGTWTVLEQPKGNVLVLLPAMHGLPRAGDELRIGRSMQGDAPDFHDLLATRVLGGKAAARVEAAPVAEAPAPARPPVGRKRSDKLKKDSK